jgi:hypothetical protein
MFNLINGGFGGSSPCGCSGGGFGAGGFGGGSNFGMGGFGAMSSPLGMGGMGMGGGFGMDPMAAMMQSMMSMMMGMMSQGMMGSLMGAGRLSPMGSAGMNPGFGGGGANSLGDIGRNFLGASPSGKNRRRGGGGGGVRGGGGGGGGKTQGSGSSAGAATSGNYQANGPGVRNMLKKAGSMVGLQEGRDRAKIQQVTGKSGINPATTPWCAAFAMNLIKDHGLDDLKGLSNRNYCPTIESWARGKGKYGTPGKYKPKPGDAILFDWEGGKGTTDHIGIVEKVKNGKVYTIEGNSSDSVKRKVYPLNSSVIDGYVITGKKK